MTVELIPVIDYFNKEIIRLTKENEGRRIHNQNLHQEYEKLNKSYLELQQENQNLKEQILLLKEGKIV